MAENTKQDDVRIDLPWRRIILIGLAVVVIWLVGGLMPFFLYGREAKDSGPFGDTFGLVNSLFTGLAFFGIIITIWLQMRDLALQRQVMMDTRKELEGSKAAQEKQATILEETAKLNALIALTEHAAKAYQHASTLELSPEVREARAREYDGYVDKLHSFVQELATKDAQGFAFLAMEQDRSGRSPVELSVESIGSASSGGPPENRQTSFQAVLRFINRTDYNVTLIRVDVFLKSHNGKRLTVPVPGAADRILPPHGGTTTIRVETEKIRASENQVPTLGLVVVRIAQQNEPIRFVLNEAIAREVEGAQA